MTPFEKAAIMAFGAALAVIGVILFSKNKGTTEGTSKIKFAKFEFELSTPSLFIFLIGCGLLVFPFFGTEQPSGDGAQNIAATSSALSANSPVTPVSPETTHQRQSEMEAKLAELQARLELAEQGRRESGATNASFGAMPRGANISGRWNSITGSFYVVQQFGAQVAIQEYTNGVISAVGEGTFDGVNLDASFQTLVGEVDVDLNLTSDRSRLTGQLTYLLTGGTLPFEMHR